MTSTLTRTEALMTIEMPHTTKSGRPFLPVTVNVNRFVFAHGSQPRGNGNWAFCPASKYDGDDYLNFVRRFRGSYSEARKAAIASFREAGIYSIVVCS